ncbi:alpha-L-fucosidase [Filimonas zeae]|uniref:alpha-L-fucosidase n=1 Tax=Filimonas zeae TaxID=1737353 RepID=A0A917IU81_9BACT|nr:alpha-L-fucosidase [Filimonas zeae]MDR6339383.1 alpha-L-fucosidase [Filimonas zeae]GGH63845.1 hypothetical protein GCM10011379_15210 [Filimonas zeae]
MNKSFLRGGLLLATLFLHKPVIAQQKIAADKMDWWHKARFGMFIHWGVYSVPAGIRNGGRVDGLGEWIMQDAHIPRAEYAAFAKQFNPDKYDPEAWVRMAREAGMKYIVVTTKHHDGFALFNTQFSNWSVVKATPYGKDLLKPLAEACRRQGMKLGFYYSQANDWYHPGGAAAYGYWDDTQRGNMDEYIDKVAAPQVREILSNYGDVAELWWDVPTGMTPERAAKFTAIVQQLQPGIITNDRLGGDVKGDITTPEQYVPATGLKNRNWETCMTMNDTWGYKSTDHNWKTSTELIRNLVDVTSKGGNYLLNVGPEASGAFPQPIQDRLQAIGAWMKVNSEAIYGTSASPFKKLSWGRCTVKSTTHGNTLFLHIFNRPASDQLEIPGLQTTVTTATALATGKQLPWKKTTEGYTIDLSALPQHMVIPVIRLETTGTLAVADLPVTQAADGTLELPAAMADLHSRRKQPDVRIEGGEEQNIGFWTHAADWASWLFFVTTPGTYRVQAEVATPAANSAFVWGMEGKEQAGAVTATGDYNTYQLFKLGTITVREPGNYRFAIKPRAEGWEAINLKKVTMTLLP